MAKSCLFIFLNLITLTLVANCHYKEFLIYKNDTLLVDYIPITDSLKDLIQTNAINKDDCTSLNCLSGDGRKIWEIRNDSLFLKEMLNCCGNRLLDKDSVNLLRQINEKKELFGGWLSLEIYHQYGQKITNVSDDCFYEFDQDFIVKNGLLLEIKKYDNRRSKASIFRKDNYLILMHWFETIDWNLIEKYKIDTTKIVLLRFEVNEAGKPHKIEVLRGHDKRIDEMIADALIQIPDWDRYYKRGVLQKIKWNIPVKLDRKWYYEKIKNTE